MGNKILIIIPAYNEEEVVLEVIRELKQALPETDILVIDDGSNDATAKLAEQEAVFCLQLPYHLGMGAALQAGYLFAREKGYDFSVHFDADGQHIAEQIPKILTPVELGECDVALGSRFLSKESLSYRIPFSRRLASVLISKALYLLIKRKICDPTSGFRALNKKAVAIFCRDYPCDYPEVEELLLLNECNLRIKEISVEMRLRIKGKSTLTPMKSLFYLFKVFLILFLDFLWLIKAGKKER